MQKQHFFLITCLLFVSLAGSAQFTVSGVVMDSATREPLPSASVYAQNTTLGTATNKTGNFSLELKSGGYDLVISYTGYLTQQIRVTGNETGKMEILMIKEEKNLGEVVLRNTYEVVDGLEKYGDFFLKHFIGATPNAAQCKLTNPEVLKFYYYKRSNKLKVMATAPLQVSNMALGYNIRYELDSFLYYYGTNINSYRGYCLFTEMEGDDSLKRVWNKNRNAAYFGSRLHFMRSYYDSTLNEDGWLISMMDENNNTKFNLINNPYDTTYYGALDSNMQVEIWFPRKLTITYTKKKPEVEYIQAYKLPKNLYMQVSYADLRDAIEIKENGYYYEQKDWITQGYWSWKNLADLLPYDFVPN